MGKKRHQAGDDFPWLFRIPWWHHVEIVAHTGSVEEAVEKNLVPKFGKLRKTCFQGLENPRKKGKALEVPERKG